MAILEGGETALAGGEGSTRSDAYTSTRRVFRIIDMISRSGERLTAKKLARDLGVSLSTCYQLVGLLIEEGYVEKLPHLGGYRLGPTFTILNERVRRRGVGPALEGILVEVSRRAGTPAYFATLSEGEVVVLHVESPPNVPPAGVAQGFRGASHALALGKILIASGGAQAISDYIASHRLESFTARTITDPIKLEAHLKDINRRGYATDYEEFAHNLCCVAAPVQSEDRKVRGAIGLSATASCPAREFRRLTQLARGAAREARRAA